MFSSVIGGFAVRLAQQNEIKLDRAQERLASALRINRASDDAAGLSMAESLRTQVRGSRQAARNIQDAISIVRVGGDGIESLLPTLQRMRELVLQAGNGVHDAQAIQAIEAELNELRCMLPEAFFIGRYSRLAFDGNPFDRSLDFQVGANAGDTMRVDYNPLRDQLLQAVIGAFGYTELANHPTYKSFTFSAFFPAAPPPASPAIEAIFPKRLVVNPATQANIDQSLVYLDETISNITAQASYLGAAQNRLEHRLNQVTSYTVDVAAAESRIRDADMAATAGESARADVLMRGSLAVASQLHFKPGLMLQLLEGTPTL